MGPPSILRHRVVFAVWLASLYAGWVVTWYGHGVLLVRWLPQLGDRTADTLFWLLAKMVVWLAPASWVLLREVRAESPLIWLGVRGPPNARLAVLAALAWLGIQVAKDLVTSTLPSVAPIDAALFNALVVAPLLEETVFRGFALQYLVDGRTSRRVAIGVTSVAWALLHVPGWLFRRSTFEAVGVEFVGVAAFGVVLGALRLRSRALFGPILVHFVNNAWHTGFLTRLVRLAIS